MTQIFFYKKFQMNIKKNEKKVVIKDDYRLNFLWEKKFQKN